MRISQGASTNQAAHHSDGLGKISTSAVPASMLAARSRQVLPRRSLGRWPSSAIDTLTASYSRGLLASAVHRQARAQPALGHTAQFLACSLDVMADGPDRRAQRLGELAAVRPRAATSRSRTAA